MTFCESVVEDAALAWLGGLSFETAYGPDITPDERGSDPEGYRVVILEGRLREALERINPDLPAEAIEEAYRKLTHLEGADTVARNRRFHKFLVDGVQVEYRNDKGEIRGGLVNVLDYDDADRNDFLAANQFTVVENKHERRPDIVLFVNGLPLGVIELKNAADEEADVWQAFKQIQTYKAEIPSLFDYNEIILVSDGTLARVGTLTAGKEWFLPWKTIGGDKPAEPTLPELRVAIQGIFDKRRFLDLLRWFIVFEDMGGGALHKKMAAYHQFHAVNVAVEQTLRASRMVREIAEARAPYGSGQFEGAKPGDRRIGVVWHTQGAGKSLSMVFYTGRVMKHLEMENPTVVVLTDRIDLDGQLFGTFSRCKDTLGEPPVQAEDRAHLRKLLDRVSGGIVFTTIQKFFPEKKGDKHPALSDRRNIVVIADEAHRTQYDFIDGYASHMRDALPYASFIGFTGTPIELADKNTRAVFGDHISVYTVIQAVADGATVPIYYESRLVPLEIDDSLRDQLDEEFEEVTESEEIEEREKLKTKWAQMEALVGTESRIERVAEDIVQHYEERLTALEGKAMIVCMSRRICVELHNAIAELRPDWVHGDDGKGSLKVVMTGSAEDGPEWQQHIRNKARRGHLADRFKDPADPFQVVIVRDMWLTGFDAPSLHTMYIDKPMRGHGLMQAIARVNRVFRDKPGGLVVDYLGIAHELKRALAIYAGRGDESEPAIDQEKAVAKLLELHEVCCSMFDGFDWSKWTTGNATEKLSLLPAAQEHILSLEDGKDRFIKAVLELSKAFALAVPNEKALRIRDDVGFFQAVAAALQKRERVDKPSADEIEHAIRQLVSKAVSADEVIDIFASAGLKRPDISILSDEFLAEVQGMKLKRLAFETLRKLLEGEIRTRRRKNIVQARSFAEMLADSVRKYQNRAIEAALVIEELIELAKKMREADRRGEELGLTDDEVAFYDALETNDSAVAVLGDETLRTIARELVESVRGNIRVDWTQRENVQAHIRVHVKRILRRHGYPPDKQEKATDTVLEQAKTLCEHWVAA